MHSDSKIPAKVDSDIRKAIASDPHLKTSDIVVGKSHVYQGNMRNELCCNGPCLSI